MWLEDGRCCSLVVATSPWHSNRRASSLLGPSFAQILAYWAGLCYPFVQGLLVFGISSCVVTSRTLAMACVNYLLIWETLQAEVTLSCWIVLLRCLRAWAGCLAVLQAVLAWAAWSWCRMHKWCRMCSIDCCLGQTLWASSVRLMGTCGSSAYCGHFLFRHACVVIINDVLRHYVCVGVWLTCVRVGVHVRGKNIDGLFVFLRLGWHLVWDSLSKKLCNPSPPSTSAFISVLKTYAFCIDYKRKFASGLLAWNCPYLSV